MTTISATASRRSALRSAGLAAIATGRCGTDPAVRRDRRRPDPAERFAQSSAHLRGRASHGARAGRPLRETARAVGIDRRRHSADHPGPRPWPGFPAEGFSLLYARAKCKQRGLPADKLPEIADDGSNNWMECKKRAARSALLVETDD
jgi:hypothetical protein